MAIYFPLACQLKIGTTIFCGQDLNADKTPRRARVTGKMQRPTSEWQLPIKHGLRDSFYLNQDNCKDWFLSEAEALLWYNGMQLVEFRDSKNVTSYIVMDKSIDPTGMALEVVTVPSREEALNDGLSQLMNKKHQQLKMMKGVKA